MWNWFIDVCVCVKCRWLNGIESHSDHKKPSCTHTHNDITKFWYTVWMRKIFVWKKKNEHWKLSRIKKISSLFNRLRLIRSKNTHHIPLVKFTWESGGFVAIVHSKHQQSHSITAKYFMNEHTSFLFYSIKTESHCFLCLFWIWQKKTTFPSKTIGTSHEKCTFSLQTGNMIEMRSNSWYFNIGNEMFLSLWLDFNVMENLLY